MEENTTEEEYKKDLKTAPQALYYRFYLIISASYFIVGSLLGLFFFILKGNNRLWFFFGYEALIWIVTLPLLVYFIRRYIYHLNLKLEYIQEVNLLNLGEEDRGYNYFSFKMKVEEKVDSFQTLTMFSLHKFGPNHASDFKGKRALVGYSYKDNRAIIIKITGDAVIPEEEKAKKKKTYKDKD